MFWNSKGLSAAIVATSIWFPASIFSRACSATPKPVSYTHLNNVEKFYNGTCEYEENVNTLVIRTYDSEIISKEEFKSLILKINNSRMISKFDKESLLIKYIVYAIKNNREYDFLISLYMNINDLRCV